MTFTFGRLMYNGTARQWTNVNRHFKNRHLATGISLEAFYYTPEMILKCVVDSDASLKLSVKIWSNLIDLPE